MSTENTPAHLLQWDRDGRADIYATFQPDDAFNSVLARATLCLQLFPEFHSIDITCPAGAVQVLCTNDGDAVPGAAIRAKQAGIQYDYIGEAFAGAHGKEAPELLVEAGDFSPGHLTVTRGGAWLAVFDEADDYNAKAVCQI